MQLGSQRLRGDLPSFPSELVVGIADMILRNTDGFFKLSAISESLLLRRRRPGWRLVSRVCGSYV